MHNDLNTERQYQYEAPAKAMKNNAAKTVRLFIVTVKTDSIFTGISRKSECKEINTINSHYL